MSHPRLENVNIESVVPLATPREMKAAIPLTAATIGTVARGRETIEHILDGDDPRLFAVVGPCSIHNLQAAEEYARKLKVLADEISDSIYLVMRVYFEKPRSSVGWKGLINDPYMNDTFHVEEGIRMARHFLFRVAEIGLPAVFSTTGNSYPHVVLRGGKQPNYDAASIAACEKTLREAHLPQNIVVDCSHGNSGKKPERQGPVLLDVLSQLEAGNRSIRGFMLESNLEGGNQPMQANPALLNPRCSITDACIDWPTTEALLREAHGRLSKLMRQIPK